MTQSRLRKQRRSRSILGACVELVERRLLMSAYVVNSTADFASPPAGQMTLRSAITAANANPGADTITFDPNLFKNGQVQTIQLSAGEMVFSDANGATTVTGPGASKLTIDAQGNSRIFEIYTSVPVNLSGMTLQHGSVTTPGSNGNTFGGAIASAGKLSLNSMALKNNAVVASGYNPQTNLPGNAMGGAIYSTGPLTVIGTDISNNSAKNIAQVNDSGLGLEGAAYGGGIYAATTLTLSGDNISNNQLVGSLPSSIQAIGSNGIAAGAGVYGLGAISIVSSNFEGNNATAGQHSGVSGVGVGAYGGAVFGQTSLTVDDSVFRLNGVQGGEGGVDGSRSGVGRGGAIFVVGPVTVSNTEFYFNQAAGGIIDSESDYIYGGYADSDSSAGGALFALGDANLTRVTMAYNSVFGGGDRGSEGGAAYVGGHLTMTTSTLEYNSLSSSLGGASEFRTGGQATGGALSLADSSTITRSTIAYNTATGGHGYDLNPEDGGDSAGGNAYGGGIYSLASLTIYNSTVANNSAAAGDGGSGIDPSSSHINLAGGNGGSASGGGIYILGNLNAANITLAADTVSAGAGGPGGDYGPDTNSPGQAGTASGPGIVVVSPAVYTITNSITQAIVGSNSGSASNISDIAAKLGDLVDNGGPTPTMLPLAGSPALDAGNNALVPPGVVVDQRGLPRFSNGRTDLGAVESQPDPAKRVIGTPIGTSGSYNNSGNTIAKAFDGNLNTYFDGPTANGNTVGLDLGSAKTITYIGYAPRAGYASRMVGGIFQASNSSNFSSPVTLYQIGSTPTAGAITTVPVANFNFYRYIRYVSPNGSYGDIAEFQVFGASVQSPVTLSAGGQLTITGSSSADEIQVTQNDANISVLFNGAQTNFATSSVKSIVINAGDGDDTIAVGSSDTLASTINAGAGNDLIIARNDSTDKVDGGAGDDTVASDAADSLTNVEHVSTSSVFVSGRGTLYIIGTDAADSIDVQLQWQVLNDQSFNVLNGQPLTDGLATININGTQTLVPGAKFQNVWLNALNGSDTVNLNAYSLENDEPGTTTFLTTVLLGGGDDTAYVQLSSFSGVAQVLSVGGGAGNDTIRTYSSNVATITGGSGNDSFDVNVNEGNLEATVYGGDGNDFFEADSAGADGGVGAYFVGGNGDDTFSNHDIDNSMTAEGDAGIDTILVTVDSSAYYRTGGFTLPDDVENATGYYDGDLVVHGNALNNKIDIVNSAVLKVYGGGGNDILGNPMSLGTTVLYGEGGDDTLIAGREASVNYFYGGEGTKDVVDYSGRPEDLVIYLDGSQLSGSKTGEGYDYVAGHPVDGPSDTIDGTVERVYGGNGNDFIVGSVGDNALYGNDGNDTLTSNGGTDALFGGNGNDTFDAQDNASTYIDGGPNTDTATVDAADTVLNVENVNKPVLQQLTGTAIGTPGSYNNNANTIAKVFDGNLNTYFDAPAASGSWVGLDLGTAKVVNQFSYAPRTGFASRMVGGMLQASNSANFSSGVVTLFTVSTAPAVGSLTTQSFSNITAYLYYRYIGPANSYCNIAELKMFGPAVPTTGPSLGANGTLTVTGTTGNDTITINETLHGGASDTASASVVFNGQATAFSTGVTRIVVHGLDGNDLIVLNIEQGDIPKATGIDLDAALFGDGGSDSITINPQSNLDLTTAPHILADGGDANDFLSVHGDAVITLHGGDGDDQLYSEGFDSTQVEMDGDRGNDSLTADLDTVPATLNGGEGNDTFSMYDRQQTVAIIGGGGIDTFIFPDAGLSAPYTIDLRGGAITHSNISIAGDVENLTTYYEGTITLIGNDSDNVFNIFGAHATIYGNGGNDTIQGGSLETVYGGPGNDVIFSGESKNVIYGDEGDDTIVSTFGDDSSLYGGAGNDVFVVDDGYNQTIDGGADTDSAIVDDGDQVTNVENVTIVGPTHGSTIGTAGSYNNSGNTKDAARDLNFATYFDAPTASGGWVGVDMGSPIVVTSASYAPRIGFASRMAGGKFQACNSADFSTGVVTLFTIPGAPVEGRFTTSSFINSTAYRYYRYLGPDGSYCNIAELQFHMPVPTKLSGTLISSPGSYNNLGNAAYKAEDGILTNYYDAANASGDWVGIDLGSAKVVTQVRYAPRVGFESRMVNGVIQASNTADFSSGVVDLYTISSAPASGSLTTRSISNTMAYRYYRYLGPDGAYCDIAEIEFDG